MESKLIKEFNLPNYIKGKSFAEASKAIDKKFEGREGAEAIATKKALLARLSEVQEYTKMQSEAAQPAVPNMGEQMFNSGVAPQVQGQNQMMIGGIMSPETANLATDEAAKLNAAGKPGIGDIAGAAETTMGFAKNAFGDTGIDTTGLAGRQDAVDGRGWSAAGDGLKGASEGAKVAGVPGAIVGAVIGAGSSLIGSARKDKQISDANMNAGLVENNKFSNDFAKGGKMSTNEYADGGEFEDTFKDVKMSNTPSLTLGNYGFTGAKSKWQMNTQGTSMKGEDKLVNAPSFNTDVLGKNTAPYSDAETGNLQNKDNFKKEGNDFGQTAAQAARLAPIVGNALQLGNMKNSAPVKLDRLDSRYKENRVDEKSLENRVQNEANNTTRALAGATNGSMGALRANLTGSQLNKTNALSDSYLKADGINNNESKTAQSFNNRNETINLRQGTVEQQMNDQNAGALNSAKSALQSQLANDIGSFGKEKVNMKQVAEMFGYSWDGKYMRDKSGKIVKPEDIKTTNSGKDKKQDESK